jgi:TP901 family phage tail tape measure protein
MKIAELFAELGIKSDKASFRKAQADIQGLGKNVLSGLRGISGGIGKKLGGVATQFAGGLKNAAMAILPIASAGAVGAALVGVTKDALDFDKALTALDVSSNGALGSMDEFRRKILDVSKRTGVSKEELTSAVQQFVALTGDGKAAAASMEAFARIAKATGSDISDISQAAAALTQQLKIDPKDMEQVFSIIVAGGKAGAVELKDMASLLASLSAGFKQFAGSTGPKGVSELSSAFQIVRQNFGSASEAATGLESLLRSLVDKSAIEKLRKAGVKPLVKDAKTGEMVFRNLTDIILEISDSKLAKDPSLIADALGRAESVKAFYALRDNRDAWVELKIATMKANDVARDYARVQASASAKLDLAFNRLKVRISEALTPDRVEALADAMESVLNYTIKIVGWFEKLGDKLGGWRKDFKEFLADLPGNEFVFKHSKAFREAADPESRAIMGSKINAEREGRDYRRPIITTERIGSNGPTLTTEAAGPRGSDDNRTFNATINVNGGTISSPRTFALDIRQELQNLWNTEMRKVAR